ncbi:hypothetical protein C8R47DRAFT_1112029 [Mycena vitilis]|nr:hypothetical protein C8R47DRAFT_1112029 [Mycena vitilis]
MPLLLVLSPEIVSCILNDLALDSESLNALCLTGNHNLLALTRPYTWLEVNMVLGAEPQASSRTAERLSAFFADPAKPMAVRALNITLVGPYVPEVPAINALVQNLETFVNVTHFSLDCIRSHAFSFDTPGRLVRDVVECLHSLVSIEVVGCNAHLLAEMDDMKDRREEDEEEEGEEGKGEDERRHPLQNFKLAHVT